MGVWNWLHFYPFPALEWTKNVTGKWSIFHIFDKFFSFFKNHLFLRFPQVHTRKMKAKKASKVSVKNIKLLILIKSVEYSENVLSPKFPKLSQNEEKQLTLTYDFCIFEIGKCSFLGKTIGKLTFSIKCSFIGISSKYLQNFRYFWLFEKLTDFETWFRVLEHSFVCFVNNYEEAEREEAHSKT